MGNLKLKSRHRVLCGDSTKADDVERLMDGEMAALILADPPYGMNLDTDYSKITGSAKAKIQGGGKKYPRVIGDGADFSDDIITSLFMPSWGAPREMFLWGADYYSDLIDGRADGSWLVWDKRGSDEADKIIGASFELCWSKVRHGRDIARIKWMGAFGAPDARNRLHPTQKPIALMVWLIQRWPQEGIIADPFLGSGTTLIAAEQLGRKCYGLEISPAYCDVIVNRWQKLTGEQAVNEKTGDLFPVAEA